MTEPLKSNWDSEPADIKKDILAMNERIKKDVGLKLELSAIRDWLPKIPTEFENNIPVAFAKVDSSLEGSSYSGCVTCWSMVLTPHGDEQLWVDENLVGYFRIVYPGTSDLMSVEYAWFNQ
jgi:hypothetical protein